MISNFLFGLSSDANTKAVSSATCRYFLFGTIWWCTVCGWDVVSEVLVDSSVGSCRLIKAETISTNPQMAANTIKTTSIDTMVNTNPSILLMDSILFLLQGLFLSFIK